MRFMTVLAIALTLMASTLIVSSESTAVTLTQLTNNPGTDWMPHWSPDGSTIVYVSSQIIIDHPQNETQDIYTIPASGGTPTKLTTYIGVDGYGPKYSPDGTRILYSTTMNSNAIGIWSIPSTGGVSTYVYDTPANDFRASWSPDGSQIAYRSETPNQTLWVVSSNGSGSGLIQLTTAGDYTHPVWSPDGSTILFNSLTDDADLYTMPSIGGVATNITNTTEWIEYSPAYSPDGQWIAFMSDRGGTRGIWVMPSTGGEPTQIVEGYVDNPAWSPDGTQIAFEWATGDPDLGTSYDREIWIASDLPTVPPSIELVYGTSYIYAESMAIHNDYLWISDNNADMIHRLNPANGSVILSANYMFSGLTFIGDYLYGIGGVPEPTVNSTTIYKMEPEEGTILSSVPLQFSTPNPCSLAYDGYYFWVGDSILSKIYKVDPGDGSLIDSFAYGEFFIPAGLAHDGTNLWIAEYNPDMIHKADPTDGSILSSFIAPDAGAIGNPTGLDFDDSYNLWAIIGGTGNIYMMDVGATPNKPLLSLSSTNLDFGSINTTMTFDIENACCGDLFWQVVGTPDWIASIDPMNGVNNDTVYVTIDRSGLPAGAYEYSLSILSNGGDGNVDIDMDIDTTVVGPLVSVSESSGMPGTTVEIPIVVSDLTGLGAISVDLVLEYDSSILQAIGASTTSTIAEAWGAPTYNSVGNQITIGMAGATPLNGSGDVVIITFEVAETAAVGDISDLILSNVALNEGIISVTTQNGIFSINGMYGDVSGNDSISSYDAALILQFVVGLIELAAQQIILGDVSGNGSLSSYDAALILQFAVGLIEIFPVENGETSSPDALANASSPVEVVVPDSAGVAGDDVEIPVNIRGLAGTEIIAVDLNLTYDPDILTAVEIITDDTMVSDWLIFHNIEAGQIHISMASATELSGSLPLIKVKYAVSDTAAGQSCNVAIANISLNDGSIPTTTDNGIFTVIGDTDNTPPASVTNLTAVVSNSIELAWTAPGDDGNTGTASEYIIKYGVEEITDANWDTAWDVEGEPVPSPAGTPESMTVNMPYPGVRYYFAIKTQDEIPNISGISNSASAQDTETIQLYTGWNMVSVVCMTIISIDDFLASLPQCDSIWFYDASASSWLRHVVGAPDFLNNLEYIGPGFGYWVSVTADCSWSCSTFITASPSNTAIQKPPFLLYGEVGQSKRISLKSGDAEIASYNTGSNPTHDDYYVLEVPVDGDLSEGDMVQVYVDGIQTGNHIELGGMGAIGRHNILYMQLPEVTRLLQNYPNPFNPETWIPYQLAEDSEVTVRIYNSTGQLLRTMNLGHKNSGSYVTQDQAAYWHGTNDLGERVSSGLYFYNIQAGEYAATRKMIISQ